MLRSSLLTFFLFGFSPLSFAVNEGSQTAEDQAVPLGFGQRCILSPSVTPEIGSSESSSKESSPAEEKLSIPGDTSSSEEPSPTDENPAKQISCRLPHDILGDIEKASNEARETKDNDCARDLALKQWGRSTPSLEALKDIFCVLSESTNVWSISVDYGLWEQSLKALGYNIIPMNLRSGGYKRDLEELNPTSYTKILDSQEDDALLLNGVSVVSYPSQTDSKHFEIGTLSYLVHSFQGNYAIVIGGDNEPFKDGWSAVKRNEDIAVFTKTPMTLTIYKRDRGPS
jgi:hypothetical protein